MLLGYLKRVLIIVMFAGMAIMAYADDAPVYEVDNYPPPFDGQPIDTGRGIETGRVVNTSPATPDVYRSPPPQSLPMDQRLARIEQQVNNLQQHNLTGRAEVMQKEIQMLRGQVEELSHQLQQSQNQQRMMYSDLDKRLSTQMSPKPVSVPPEANESASSLKTPAVKTSPKPQLASATTVTTSPTPKVNAEQPNVAEEQQIYQTAYDLIKSKKYNEAIVALKKMLQKYPTGQFAANAHYWLGELYGLLNKNEQAAAEFNTVIKSYPDSPKVADAQLKLGLIYSGQFKWNDAKTAFKKVINQYPGTSTARVASDQLKQIKQAGH